jgi:hypothetical protein
LKLRAGGKERPNSQKSENKDPTAPFEHYCTAQKDSYFAPVLA